MTYIDVKKKLLLTSLGCLIVIVIAFVFIHSSKKTDDPIKTPTFHVVHGKGFIFPFDVEVPDGTSYLESVLKLGTTKSIKSIYEKQGTKWVEVDREASVRFNSELKVEE